MSKIDKVLCGQIQPQPRLAGVDNRERKNIRHDMFVSESLAFLQISFLRTRRGTSHTSRNSPAEAEMHSIHISLDETEQKLEKVK